MVDTENMRKSGIVRAFPHPVFGLYFAGEPWPRVRVRGEKKVTTVKNCNLFVTYLVTAFLRVVPRAYAERLQGYAQTPHTHVCAHAPVRSHMRVMYFRNLVTSFLYLIEKKEEKRKPRGYKTGYNAVTTGLQHANPLKSFNLGGF
jgi:hypothetical protein